MVATSSNRWLIDSEKGLTSQSVRSQVALVAMGQLVENGLRGLADTYDAIEQWLSPQQREQLRTLLDLLGTLTQLAAWERADGNLDEAYETTVLAFEQYGRGAALLLNALAAWGRRRPRTR